MLSYIEPSKPRATQPNPIFNDITKEKLENSIYGNNADIAEPLFELNIEENNDKQKEEMDSTYDHLSFISMKIFRRLF